MFVAVAVALTLGVVLGSSGSSSGGSNSCISIRSLSSSCCRHVSHSICGSGQVVAHLSVP